MKKKTLLSLLIITLAFISVFAMFGCKTNAEAETFRLIVPDDWELEVGDSRSIDYAFKPGVIDRKLTFSVSNKNRASVDVWGRVTALKKGNVRLTAQTASGDKASVKLTVVKESKNKGTNLRTVNFTGEAAQFNNTLQKIVTRYPHGDPQLPDNVKNVTDYTNYQKAITKDNAVWTITNYGVLRVDENAQHSRDREQRFMGDRYFYAHDGTLLGIVADDSNGIWAIMQEGITHISMVDMSGIEKAYNMHEQTSKYVDRRGMVSNAFRNQDNTWGHGESENEGLWTSMYGAGELMRYSYLKDSGTATAEEIEAARQSATRATEAVLLLSNLRVDVGTTEAYVRYQPNALYDEVARGKFLSETALEEGADPSLNIPYISPAETFTIAYEKYLTTGERVYILDENHLFPFGMDGWSDPRYNEDVEYAKRTRLLDGYWSRSYSFEDEGNGKGGYIHWEFQADGTALGVSTKEKDSAGYYINGEDMRGIKLSATREVPARLWDNLIGSDYTLDDMFYKGDVSADGMIGHLFLFKIAFDILGAEDPELKNLIASTMDRMAQHVSDNNYMVVDGGGQPNTWTKFNREFFYNASQLGGAPLTSAVVLSLFKLAHYTTGYEKWHNEYRMAALDPSYEYAKLMTQYSEQAFMLLMLTLDEYVDPTIRKTFFDFKQDSPEAEFLMRMFLNYSDEEMAMLAYYILFQMEDDEEILTLYREGLECWWASIKYSENPLWYYIYQLAYPGETIYDAYGNNILETAAWSLSRHPMELIKYSASNENRDDIAEVSLLTLIPDSRKNVLTYDISENDKIEIPNNLIEGIIHALYHGPKLNWVVAAPDEKAFKKYNKANYTLHSFDHDPHEMEGSTTYTLPFWMGLYHGMLKL